MDPALKPNRQQRTLVFVTFETSFAPSGGLAAVMKVLPQEMARHETCFVLAPYFPNISKPWPVLGTFSLTIRDQTFSIEIRHATDAGGFPAYLLASEPFFTAPSDPYTNPDNPHKLVEDALFFCAAAPQALIEIARLRGTTPHNLVLHLQDWETACVAQAIHKQPEIQAVACVLTLHNPYDRYVNYALTPLVSNLMSHLHLVAGNILAQMIPLMAGPLSTVSQNFADELTGDPLHTEVFAPHLQGLLASQGVVGVDNGLFGQLAFPFSEDARQQAAGGNFETLQQEKWQRRQTLAEVLEAYQHELSKNPKPGRDAWGDDLDLSDPWQPVFLFMGRDDPRQKGFDVAAEAIRRIPPSRARYIFTPMPGAEGFEGLKFLKDLAQERPGEVKAFPFRLTPEAFMALTRGSSFLVMGSLYEPFGGASEAYLAGMPVVARASGGLVQQIAPYPSAALSRQGRQLVALFHGRKAEPTGFLYREPSVPDVMADWQKIVECSYWPGGDRIEARKGIPLFDAMVQRAAWALQDAIDLYQTDQTAYAQMIYHGYQMLDNFGWDRAIREYRRLYDRVCQ
jgi:glycogen synthase